MAAVPSASFFASPYSQLLRCKSTYQLTLSFRPHQYPFLGLTRHSNLSSVRQCSISDTTPTPILNTKPTTDIGHILQKVGNTRLLMEDVEDGSLEDFFELAESLVRSVNGAGPPRWFSSLGCSSRLLDNCPLLLYLPGIDGTGAGLALQQKRLGKVFDIWCLHIPAMDRTPFTGLVSMVEKTIISESNRYPNRPIYIVGESLGGCLALAVAARNPDIDLILILSNPATSLDESLIQSLVPNLMEMMPDELVQFTQPFLLSFISVLRATLEKELPQGRKLVDISADISSYISILGDFLPKKTLLWKLQMLRSASAYTNPLLHAVKAQILLLFGEKDQVLPNSAMEASRLYRALPGCEMRKFGENGHFLFLEDGVNLMTIVKATRFYRRGKTIDHVADYLQPTPSEFTNVYESTKWVSDISSPVILSTLEDGRIIKGLAGIPSEGPTIYIGNHMLLGIEVVPLVLQLMLQRNIHLRGISHPILYLKYTERILTMPLWVGDILRIMGNVPVSATNFFKLLKNKSNVLLYPGGAREALHRKGEQYKLFWPEETEFVRMAARFGAKIVPFGVVGEDDLGQVVLDYTDLIKVPFFRDLLRDFNDQAPKLRSDSTGEVANQDLHLPGIIPKIPGRYYFLIGKPIETQGKKNELRDVEKSHQVYMEVKSEVEKCIDYLKHKREKDPYRNILARVMYQTINGFESEVPTFQL